MDTRAFRELLEREHAESVERMAGHRARLREAESRADELVLDLYGLTASKRALIARDYKS